MKLFQSSLIACSLALAGTAWAQTTSSDAGYLQRVTPRYQSFAGSNDNLASLTSGLRSGSQITLRGNGETAVFTPSTRPMGYGNITRSLDLAQRQLAAQGITDPTPSQLQAALQGGTITGPKGTTTYAGILQMRSDGMGWGKIANTVGVHPGLGKTTAAAPATAARITTPGGGTTTAQGNAKSASVRATGNGNSHVTTASGGNSASAHASARGLGNSASVTSAAGAHAGGAMGGSMGGGHGNAGGGGGGGGRGGK